MSRKLDPLKDVGIMCFRMSRGQRYSIKAGTLVVLDDRSGTLRLSAPDEPVRSFRVPEGAKVEGHCILWKQESPLTPFENHMAEHGELTTFNLAERIGRHMPAIERAIDHSAALERREREDSGDATGVAFVRGPHLEHRSVLRRLHDDLKELLHRVQLGRAPTLR